MLYQLSYVFVKEMSGTGNREVTGSNPVEVLNFFQASLRNCINCVHCDDHFFIFSVSIVQFLFNLLYYVIW